ncbi:endothelin-converting enzyme homolog isoform X1 [Wyeomyia smithii]|uniref:endothelin-converting enzyme homolog isoform X1 n=2 Tax=Wyeomyia smithii TaxID=174621 RepID=UPI002467F460|nr:endothelin-converting enzyme homolog isoform X1 [Wyeomyia smithii]XP_055546149.1 endothelin-converting enzyme homolog isoform X1 [Wyeomyia smithii]
MSVQMTRYKQAQFVDEDSSSIGSIQINETSRSPTMHIRYHTARGTSLWNARSKLEKVLILLVLLSAVTICVLIGLLATESTRILHVQPHVDSNNYKDGKPPAGLAPQTCLNKHCIFAASEILHSIDTTVNPCDDFYGFACNQWIKNNPIPDGKSMWGTFGKLEQQNQLVVKNALERPEAELKSKAEKKAKLYYQSCLDEDETMEKLGAEPLLKLLKSIGGWNVTANASGFDVSKWSLQKSLQTLQIKYNMGGLFGWAVGEDDRNSSKHIIQIDQGGLTLPSRDNYLNKTANAKILNAYLDYMTKVSVLLGAEEAEARRQMSDVVEFETRLANITTPQDMRRDEEEMYHLMTLTTLQEKAPFINWRDHFEEAFRLVKRKITEKEKVVVYAPEYLQKLDTLVQEYHSTDEKKTILNNYLVWQTVRTLTACLSKAFRDAYKGLRKALIGSDGGEEPWRYCVSDTTNVLGFAIGAMFVRDVFHGESKPRAEEMINEVRTAFKDNLKSLVWMDNETRRLAEEKADAISDMIGFPDYILNADELDKKYQDLNIDPKMYFDNNINFNIYSLKKNLEKLDQPVNKTRWGMTPPTVNAYYTPTKNQIVFPAGILQLPFFDMKNPKSLNYGAMGVVMGHELTHAFDDQGREYDKFGNLHQWWNNKTIERFKKQTECFNKQYSTYKVNGKNLNGKQTMGENIADNGGLKAAFHAYIRSEKLSTSDTDTLPLPGLNMTHRQLFFVSFAQVWCSAVTDETTTLQIEKDPHSPPMYRVIGSLSNLREFADTFKCPLGSRMNPERKCEVW